MAPATLDRLTLLPAAKSMHRDAVLQACPLGPVVACDFYVDGAERGVEVAGGYRMGRLLNVDHHAPTRRMTRIVSSTNLAIAQLLEEPADPASSIVLNHTDCDSILSGGIMAGILAPEPHYGAAAIAADHTGDEDRISDLLQGLETLRDPWLSFRSLLALEGRRPLDPAAAEALKRRERLRTLAETYVREGRFRVTGFVWWAMLEQRVDSTFFRPLLPKAWLILLFEPLPASPGRWEAKVRLGRAAPEGMSLHDLKIREWDPGYGGRWNAGANRRAGGTSLSVEVYAAQLWRCASAWRRP